MSDGASAKLLLERDGELARLGALLDDARAGNGAVVAIEGPAGIGKTELLSSLGQLAGEQEFRLLRARARELEAGMPFAVADQLFGPVIISANQAERRHMLQGPASIGAGALGVTAGAAPDSEFVAIHGLYWLCVNIAERAPLVLAVDDLQWADGPSIAWLGYFARRTAELPVLLAVSVREGDRGARDRPVLDVLEDAATRRMRLPPLSQHSVTALVRARLGQGASDEFCSACWELAGGNPLHVAELLAAAWSQQLTGTDADIEKLRSAAPTAVGSSILARLALAGPNAIALAEALAVLGAQTEVATAAELAGLPVGAAELIADELVAAQILAPARPLDFYHPLISEAVYASIALGARRLAHRRAAAILNRAGATERVAAHLLATGPVGDPWVVERLRTAAASARDRGAPEMAARYLRRALDEPPTTAERPDVLRRLGSAEWYTGRPLATAHLEEAFAQAEDVPVIRAAAAALSNAYGVLDQADKAMSVLQHASARIGSQDPHRALSLQASSALVGVLDDRTAHEAHRTMENLRAVLEDLDDPPVRLLVVTAQVAMRRNQAAEAERFVERALACKPYPPPVDAATSTMVTMIGLESYGPLQRLCDDTMRAARRRSATPGLMAVASFSAWGLRQRGELADAEAQARWALDGATGIFAIDALAHLIETLVERGEPAQAQAELQRLDPPMTSHSIMVVTYLMARGRLRATQGRHAEALDDFLAAGERCERLEVLLAMYHWRSEAAVAHAFLGNRAEGRRLARAELEITRSFGRPRALGVSLRAAGLVEGGDHGLELLAEAVSVLETSEAPVELARALTDYGAALRRAGQRSQARDQLERGLDLAHYWGAQGIAAQARAELIAAGAKPRRDAVTGRDALTVSELRVARLAAAGKTNREIAQTLFITTKTASAHLSRVYRKLGVTRRSRLAEALVSSAPASHRTS